MLIADIFFHINNVFLRLKSPKTVFTNIYKSYGWGTGVSVSGSGSDLKQTAQISKIIPSLVKQLKIKSLLDAPCGDFHWMSQLNLKLDRYIGIDIVSEIVNRNNNKYKNKLRHFLEMNVITEKLPKTDMVLCRDCLVHFSNRDIRKTIKNFKKSGSKYLLTTTFTDLLKNVDIPTGRWRPINLEASPFNLPKPLKLINEKCSEVNGDFSDKSLGLWLLQDIRI